MPNLLIKAYEENNCDSLGIHQAIAEQEITIKIFSKMEI